MLTISEEAAPELAAAKPRMWRHFCRVEGVPLQVAGGEPCNWCDAIEPVLTDATAGRSQVSYSAATTLPDAV